MNPRLPEELSVLINSLLTAQDLAQVSQVSKKNKEISAKPTLWINLAKKDFYAQISDDPNNPAKNQYREIKIGISREKDQFIKTIVLNQIKQEKATHLSKLQNHKISTANQGFLKSLVTIFKETKKLNKALRMQNKEISNFNKTYNQLSVDEKSFRECYAELLKYSAEKALKEYKIQAEHLYYALISGQLNFDPIILNKDENNKITLNSNIDFQEFYNRELSVGFSILSRLDAHLSIGCWLANSKDFFTEAVKTWFFKQACLYTCPKVIKKLFNQLKIDINEISEIEGLKCAPIFYILIFAGQYKNMNKELNACKEIISFFLNNNTNLSSTVSFLDPTNGLIQGSIGELCKEKLDKINQKSNRNENDNLLASIFDMVLKAEQDQKLEVKLR